MVKNIVIVSPIEHWEQCCLLLNSIDQHLKDFNVYLIDNTVTPCLPNYKLKNNNLKQLVWSDLISDRKIRGMDFDNGWIVQQLVKLAAYKLFDDQDYVCLGSTNLILDQFDEWPRDLKPYIPLPDQDDFFYFYYSVCRLFKIGKHQPVLTAQTPYILNSANVKSLIDYFGTWEDFQKWFVEFDRPSEFWLYDLWCQKNNIVTYTALKDHKHSGLLTIYNFKGWVNFIKGRTDMKNNKVSHITRLTWNHPDFEKYKNDGNLINLLKNVY